MEKKIINQGSDSYSECPKCGANTIELDEYRESASHVVVHLVCDTCDWKINLRVVAPEDED